MVTRQQLLRLVLPVVAAAAVTLTGCVGAPAVHDKFPTAISNEGLYRLRKCESGDNYGAVNRSGTYRGAYQFSRSTWNGTARAHYPELQGIDPAAAAPWDQDRMARALWANGGPGHWPVCSRRV
jgi:hypothetical protein